MSTTTRANFGRRGAGSPQKIRIVAATPVARGAFANSPLRISERLAQRSHTKPLFASARVAAAAILHRIRPARPANAASDLPAVEGAMGGASISTRIADCQAKAVDAARTAMAAIIQAIGSLRPAPRLKKAEEDADVAATPESAEFRIGGAEAEALLQELLAQSRLVHADRSRDPHGAPAVEQSMRMPVAVAALLQDESVVEDTASQGLKGGEPSIGAGNFFVADEEGPTRPSPQFEPVAALVSAVDDGGIDKTEAHAELQSEAAADEPPRQADNAIGAEAYVLEGFELPSPAEKNADIVRMLLETAVSESAEPALELATADVMSAEVETTVSSALHDHDIDIEVRDSVASEGGEPTSDETPAQSYRTEEADEPIISSPADEAPAEPAVAASSRLKSSGSDDWVWGRAYFLACAVSFPIGIGLVCLLGGDSSPMTGVGLMAQIVAIILSPALGFVVFLPAAALLRLMQYIRLPRGISDVVAGGLLGWVIWLVGSNGGTTAAATYGLVAAGLLGGAIFWRALSSSKDRARLPEIVEQPIELAA